MRTTWMNIASAGSELTSGDLLSLCRSSGPVAAFSTGAGRVAGRTLRYEVRELVDLWAEIELEDWTPEISGESPCRAAAVVSRGRQGFVLHAVMVTRMSRDRIRSLIGGLSLSDVGTMVKGSSKPS